MLIFGGETTDGALQNTMWRFDLGKEVQYNTTLFHCASHTQQKLVSRWGVGKRKNG